MQPIRDVNISRGDNRDGIIAACVYFACRDENVPRSTKEIAGYFDIKLQDMTRGIKKFRENWRLANPNNKDNIIKSESSNPIDFIERYCSRLSVNKELTKLCKFVACKVNRDKLIPENTPHAVASGIIYFITQICNNNISKTQIYEISNISEVTINKCYKKLENFKQQLIPPVILKKYSK